MSNGLHQLAATRTAAREMAADVHSAVFILRDMRPELPLTPAVVFGFLYSFSTDWARYEQAGQPHPGMHEFAKTWEPIP
jgi:hypothetical protein